MQKSSSNNSFLDFYRWQDAPFHKFFNLLKNISFDAPNFNIFSEKTSFCFLRKATASFCILGILLINIPIFNAYEAHVIGVTAHIKNSIADHLVINKVYYDVDDNHGTENKNEWVELYNPTDENININNWEICDNKVCAILSMDNLNIPSKSFAIVSRSATTWNYWNIPSNVIKIVLENPSSFYLANSGDMLSLKNANEDEVDAMSYEEDISVFNPAPPLDINGNTYNLPEGHILGRVPAGYDTNSASDWQDLGLPIVSNVTINPLQDNVCGYCNNTGQWYCAPGLYYSQQLNISWDATTDNISGSDKLSIDISYITDNDCDGKISDGDNSYIIKTGAANDGSYTWDGWTNVNNWKYWRDEQGFIIPYFYGYAWIEITAIGPENFIVNNSNISAPAFEPLPPGLSAEQFHLILENSSCVECYSKLENYYFDEADGSIDNDTDGNSDNSDNSGADAADDIEMKNENGEKDSDDIIEVDDGNDSDWEEEISDTEEESQETELIAPDNFPKAPKGLRVECKDGGAALEWQPNKERDLAGYNVYRKQIDVSYEKINTSLIQETNYSDFGVEPGNTYYYQVRAVDEAGQESEASLEVEINIPDFKPEFAEESPKQLKLEKDLDSESNNDLKNDLQDDEDDGIINSDDDLTGSPPLNLPIEEDEIVNSNINSNEISSVINN